MEYIKVAADTDPIRKAFAKANGVKPALFSAHSEGACPKRSGAGVVYVDHVIDLGPGAGSAGGQLVYGSSPVDLAQQRDSVTGRFLADALVSP